MHLCIPYNVIQWYACRGRRPRRPEIKSPLDATILLHCRRPVSTPANIKKTSALLDGGYNNVCVTYFHGERCDCCRWQIQRGRSKCSGRRETKVHRHRGYPSGTATGRVNVHRNRKQVDPHPPFPQRKNLHLFRWRFVLALPIFTVSHPTTIVGARVLNFCVRDGNRWTHTAINTNYSIYIKAFQLR